MKTIDFFLRGDSEDEPMGSLALNDNNKIVFLDLDKDIKKIIDNSIISFMNGFDDEKIFQRIISYFQMTSLLRIVLR